MTTIVESDPKLVGVLQQALPGTPAVLATVAALARHLERHAERAVVLGPSVPADEALRVAEEHRVLRPALGFVWIRESVDHAVLAQAMRAGVREVVTADDPAAIGGAVRRAEAVARAMTGAQDPDATERPTGGLVTVFSTKGGVGKTLVATNLGVALADRGHRVCVVDLDVEGGDVAVMLSAAPQHTLDDLARFGAGVDESAVESLLTRHSERLSVLAAPVQLGAAVSPASVGVVLDLLKQMFDVVVVDTASFFDDHALQALDHSDLLVLVGTLDIPALKSLKLAVGTLDLLNFPRDSWRVVLNRADAKVGLSTEDFETTLGARGAVTIPTSRDVLLAVNRGEPVLRAYAGRPVSRTLAAFAETVSRDLALTTDRSAPGGEGRRRGRRLRKAA